jgi:hypothetical protein
MVNGELLTIGELARESDHWVFPLGFALALCVAGPGGGDALPCLLTVGAVGSPPPRSIQVVAY